MTTITAGLLIVVLLAIVAIVALVRFRQHTKVRINAPGGMALNLEGRDTEAALNVHNVKSGGQVSVRDDTGRGANVSDVAAEKNVIVRSKAPTSPKV
jgi:uncharacterized protein (DUF58 family)